MTAMAEIACDAALDACSGFLPPKYCATMTVPPVAIAINTLTIKIFSESTTLTALTAATPEELIMAVFNMLIRTMNAESIKIGIINEKICFAFIVFL